MNASARLLVAEVAARLKCLWIYGTLNDAFHAHCSVMFAAYMDSLLNGGRAVRAEYVGKLESLRDDLRARLRADGWDVVLVAKKWENRVLPKESVAV